MSDASCLVFFRSGRCDLDGAAAAFARAKLIVERHGNELFVSYPDAPILRVRYSAAEHVAAEADEIARPYPPAAALLPCDARFEVEIDDLDSTLDEYSTLFAVQEALIEATGGFVFNTWNCGFPWPQEETGG